jgi:hypothetical protein
MVNEIKISQLIMYYLDVLRMIKNEFLACDNDVTL